MRTLIIMITVAAVGFAQPNGSAAQPQNHSIRPDVRAIVGLSIAATDQSWRARIHYTYLQRDEDRRLDSHGLVKSDDVEVSTTMFVNGVPFEQLVEHNGLTASISRGTKEAEGTAQQAEARNSSRSGLLGCAERRKTTLR